MISIKNGIKTIGLASVMALGTGLTSCNSETEKPVHDVEIQYTGQDSTNHFQTVKMEEGTSFENDSVKYVMSEGKLISIQKSTYQCQDEDNMKMKKDEFEIFAKVAKQNNEIPNTLVLTTKDIETAKHKLKREINKKYDINGIARYYEYTFSPDLTGVNINYTNNYDFIGNIKIEHDAVVYKD